MQRRARRSTDPRYKTRRWQAVRLRILARDLWRCFVPGCPWVGNVADHISPVHPGMPDAEFYAESNLRAACRDHNLAKGTDDRMAEIARGEAPAPPRRLRLSYGRG